MSAPGEPGTPPPPERALSNLAHQLRNPLAIILGYAELIAGRAGDETVRARAARIVEAAELLSVTVDDLIVVLAVEAGALSVELAPVELAVELAEAVSELERSVGRVCSVETDVGPPRVSADRAHLRRTLKNLLLNACRLSPENGEIRMSVTVEGQFAAIAVAEDASLLTDEQLAALFERFSPLVVPGREEIQTTGLELYMARRLVELQGGTIRVARGPSGGTTITFTLRLAEA